jgi:hypothetical protein
MAIVYQHTRLDNNNIFYIGIGKKEDRAFSKISRNKYWHNTVNKYGHNVNIICDDVDYNTAKQIESYLIKYYGRKDLGLGLLVNMTDGGDGTLGYNVSETTKLKMSKAHKGKTLSAEAKTKTSLARKGKGNGMFGKTPYNAKKVYCGFLNKYFNNISACSKELEISQSYLSNILSGKRPNIYKVSII